MKEATLQTLVTARVLLEQAEHHCNLGDRYLATAGLIILQDAVELIFLAVLIEKEVDGLRAIEKYTFDEMIAELIKLGIKVPKSGTLKAMNKLRVTAKHYGQIMEPQTVQGHMNAAKFAIDVVLVAAIDKTLREVFLTELIDPTPSRSHLDEALLSLTRGDYFDALISTRKAFYLEFENDYCVYYFRDISEDKFVRMGLLDFLRYGSKAPSTAKNQSWINKNVFTPFDYIRIDYDKWRMDAMEWGINTQSLFNIQRLTPEACLLDESCDWICRFPPAYMENFATRENAASCLDLTIDAIRRKQAYFKAARIPNIVRSLEFPALYSNRPVFERATLRSKVVHVLDPEIRYNFESELTGFDGGKIFYYVCGLLSSGDFIKGYVEKIYPQAIEVNEAGED